MFILTSRKTEIARSAKGPESQRLRAEDVLVESNLVQKILVILLQQITRSSVTIASLETITDMQSRCRTWPPNGSRHIRAKQKTSQETQRSLQKFLEPNRKPKVIYSQFLGIWARPVKIQMALLRERYTRLKKGLLL